MKDELELKEKQASLAKKAEEINRQNEKDKKEAEKRKEEEKVKEERRKEKKKERDGERRRKDETVKKKEDTKKVDDEDLRDVLERLKKKKSPPEKGILFSSFFCQCIGYVAKRKSMFLLIVKEIHSAFGD